MPPLYSRQQPDQHPGLVILTYINLISFMDLKPVKATGLPDTKYVIYLRKVQSANEIWNFSSLLEPFKLSNPAPQEPRPSWDERQWRWGERFVWRTDWKEPIFHLTWVFYNVPGYNIPILSKYTRQSPTCCRGCWSRWRGLPGPGTGWSGLNILMSGEWLWRMGQS